MKLKIEAEKPKKIPKDLQSKWAKNLKQVNSGSDKLTIIFLAELVELLTNEKVIFHCAGTVEYGMFSGCDFSWTLTAGRSRIIRQIKREISESWQRVEVETDNVIIHGLEKYNFNWNGECGEILSTLKIEMEIEDINLTVKIEDLGKKIYENFRVK